jgi:hypothetical protein
MIKIEKLGRGFDGFDKGLYNLDSSAFLNPKRMLVPHDASFIDNLFIAILAVSQSSKKILDLGSFFGSLPFFVEGACRKANTVYQPEWTLVDNMLYTNELVVCLQQDKQLSGHWLPQFIYDEWKNLQPHVAKLFNNGLPPSTLNEFNQYWDKLALEFNVTKPNMTMYTELHYDKYDLVSFDLSAGRYLENKSLFYDVLENCMHEQSVVILDDVLPKFPMMMSLFYDILTNTDLEPIAFSPHRVALINKSSKQQFIKKVPVDLENRYYSFYKHSNEHWGDFLVLN